MVSPKLLKDRTKVGLIFDSRAALHSGAAPARSGEPGPRILEPGSSKVWYVHIAKSGPESTASLRCLN